MSDCEHPDVRYSKDEKGAVACYVCGRLFGHLEGEMFVAFNPTSVRVHHLGIIEAENERLREALRIVACGIPATWKTGRGHHQRAYEAMSAFLIEDQRG